MFCNSRWRCSRELTKFNSRAEEKGRWHLISVIHLFWFCTVLFSNPCLWAPRYKFPGAHSSLAEEHYGQAMLSTEQLPRHVGTSLARTNFVSRMRVSFSCYCVIFHLSLAYLMPHKTEGRLLSVACLVFLYLYCCSLSACWGSRKYSATCCNHTTILLLSELRSLADKSRSCSPIGAQACCSWCRQHIPQHLQFRLLLSIHASTLATSCASILFLLFFAAHYSRPF